MDLAIALVLLVAALAALYWLDATRPLDPSERLDRLHRAIYNRERKRKGRIDGR
jgi:hypothetical protein